MPADPPKLVDPSDAKDIRNNKVLMYFSIFLTVVSVSAFLWLAGLLEWRGSSGKLYLSVTFYCEGNLVPSSVFATLYLNSKDASLSYTPDFNAGNGAQCKTVRITSIPEPTVVSDAYDHPITPKFVFVPPVDPRDKPGKDLEFPLHFMFHLRFPRSLLQYTGLSERRITLSSSVMVHGHPSGPRVPQMITIDPPSEFAVVESAPPGEIDADGAESVRIVGSPDV